MCLRKHILGHFWANDPNYFVREQKFWYTHITKPLRQLVRIVSLDQIGQYLAQNDQECIFWAIFGRFWAKNPVGGSKSFGFGIT